MAGAVGGGLSGCLAVEGDMALEHGQEPFAVLRIRMSQLPTAADPSWASSFGRMSSNTLSVGLLQCRPISEMAAAFPSAEFEKTTLVAKLAAARRRKRDRTV
jgi:uncharacterized lipoprotein YmbA